tara:strand:+ start:858 stop:2003 length:1146 start_codon:yes stop_codon:yes gene_type:complete
MPRVAKKTTEKLRKKAIRRKSLRQKKRPMKKKNNARRTRRNMRKRNKRGGAAAEEEEEEEAEADSNNEEHSNELLHVMSDPTTGQEIDDAIKRYISTFTNEEDQQISKMIMKENNKEIVIMSEDGKKSKKIYALRFIKDNFRVKHANVDSLFRSYLSSKFKMFTNDKQFHATMTSNINSAVRRGQNFLKAEELKEIQKIIEQEGQNVSNEAKELIQRVKNSLDGQSELIVDDDEMYDWALFVAGYAMIVGESHIFGLLAILASNRNHTILKSEEGPQQRPMQKILESLFMSQHKKTTGIIQKQYRSLITALSKNDQVKGMHNMYVVLYKNVSRFLTFIFNLQVEIPKQKTEIEYSKIDSFLNDKKQYSTPPRRIHSAPPMF